jgi:Family of unknown function (DUF5681)
MTRSTRSRRGTKGSRADYAVGYGRTPISGRWKKGQSGNPRGLKKGPKPVGKIIEEALMRKVSIEEDGRRVSLTVQEVIIRNLVNAAARRDLRAIYTLYRLRDQYQDSNETLLDPAELDPNDQAVIEDYLKRVQAASTSADPHASIDTTLDGENGPDGSSEPDRDTLDGET